MRTPEGRFAKGSQHLVTHGLSRSRIYLVWNAMRNRCQNPKVKAFPDYGGRGITVCARWQTFEGFYADMGDAPAGMTLDRLDNDRGYEPGNCRWATKIEQARNKRGLHMVTVEGVERPLCEWAEISGIKLKTLWARLDKGWTPEKAVSTPVRISGRWRGVVWSEPMGRAA